MELGRDELALGERRPTGPVVSGRWSVHPTAGLMKTGTGSAIRCIYASAQALLVAVPVPLFITRLSVGWHGVTAKQPARHVASRCIVTSNGGPSLASRSCPTYSRLTTDFSPLLIPVPSHHL